MVAIPVRGTVLEWARKEKHLSVEEAAGLIGVDTVRLAELEAEIGEKPNLGLLRQIAAKYEISVAALLMPEPLPLTDRPTIKDHRVLDGKRPEYTLKLRSAIDLIWENIDDLSDLKRQEPDLFVSTEGLPKLSIDQEAKEAAQKERKRIGISVESQLGWHTDREAFLRWRLAVERQGVFVHVQNIGSSDNCRGFAIFDERDIPVIFINSDESERDHDYRSRTYGLIHEYCHVLLRSTSLSGHTQNIDRSNRVERFCNEFAAEFLMGTSKNCPDVAAGVA